ncbi:putative reverse transcriptase domain-containing protein [Tanacetum coccineum]|uniref:Reverse transcriptase domain-containing protein n=1 Tax=Tanacetum coccineum TaxID=301880 RepID=A0ABQ4ZQY8_9ASTR
MFTSSTFEGRALTWWNGNVHTLGIINANHIPWTEFKMTMTMKYCPATEIKRIEQELWSLTLKGDDIEEYNNRFHELALMCPELMPTEKKKIEKGTLVRLLELVKATKENGKITKETPTTTTTTTATETTTITNNKIGGKKLPRPMLQPQLRIEVMLGISQSATVAKLYIMGDALQSSRSAKELDIWRRIVDAILPGGIQELANEGARARAYVVVENPQQNPNVVTNGKVVSTNTILRSCTLVLLNHVFKIDLLPTRLGSLDVIIGMDWLAYHRAVIDCYEKIVCIPLPNGEILEVQGERPEKNPGSLACIKANEKKFDNIRVVRDFPEVFPDDLSGLPPV